MVWVFAAVVLLIMVFIMPDVVYVLFIMLLVFVSLCALWFVITMLDYNITQLGERLLRHNGTEPWLNGW